MTIAIDLNDVVRDYSFNFFKTYVENYNREFDLSDPNFTIWSQNMSYVFPFKNDAAYRRFTYEDYAFELFGKCQTCGRSLPADLRKWLGDTLQSMDLEEPINVIFVSPMEFGESIGYTYFFISKLNANIREVYLPMDSATIWDKCDVLITANPSLIDGKPEGKKVIKIETTYNASSEADFTFKTLSKFMEDEENVSKLLENS